MSATARRLAARHLVLAAALLCAAWLAVFGDKTPPGAPVVESRPPSSVREPAPPPRAPAAATSRAAAAMAMLESLVPRDQLVPERKPRAHPRDLFAGVIWAPPPSPTPRPTPPPVPGAPALPFEYMGKKQENGQWEVYLTRGDQVFVVREGSVVEQLYRVEKISPPSMTVLYLPLGQAQHLSVGEAR